MSDSLIIKPPRSQWWDVWDQFKVHKGAMAGSVVFIAILLFCFVGPLLWPYDATFIDIRSRNQGFSWEHPFGTDQLGRDIFARMMAGGQVSLAVGLVGMLLSIFLGTLIGTLAGYFRRVDGLLMRLTDLFLALPLLPLLLVMSMLFRQPLSAAFGAWLDPGNFDAGGRQRRRLSDLTRPIPVARDPGLGG